MLRLRKFPRVPFLLCILSLVSHPGCTVKEERDLCPAQLVLALPPLEGPAVLHVGAGEEYRLDSLAAGQREYRTVVPRGRVSVLAWTPADLPFLPGRELRIPEGEEAPEIRLFSREYDIRGELLQDSVRLHKNYCTLDLQVRSRDGTFPYSFTVSGGFCGYDARGQVLPGVFRCRARPDASGSCRIRIPRQGDDSLMLELSDGDGVVRSFALGEYLRESGYDWTAEDLGDAGIAIDYARTSVTFFVDGWSVTLQFDMVI